MEAHNRAGLSPERWALLEPLIPRFGALGELVAWGARQSPQVQVIDVVVQDEFTHDVVVERGDGLYLVYDST